MKVGDFEVAESLRRSKGWMRVRVEAGEVRTVVTDCSQKQLRETVFVDHLGINDEITKGEVFETVESVKSIGSGTDKRKNRRDK